ncbi:MAG: peptidase S13 [Fibrobacter sp.]|nr:peptidase S13 [Fibrobacter sp.]
MFKFFPIKLIISTIVITALHQADAHADKLEVLKEKISRLVTNGSVILHNENGKRLISLNADKLFIPASTIKIVTSTIALDLLGKDYRFKTEFYQNDNRSLAVKGWGDPYLISEEIQRIAKELKNKGIDTIKNLILDQSSFEPLITIPGASKTLNPYDAANGALITNFNTLNLRKGTEGTLYSAEAVTPLTPLAITKGHLVQIGKTQRINLSLNRNDCITYAGELFCAIFKDNGITIHNEKSTTTTLDSSWKLIYTHYNSHSMVDITKGLLKYSNNFIANQLFLTIGAEKQGYPATLQKGKGVFEDFIRTRLKINTEQLTMLEGSGLSRDNKVTANVLIGLLENRKDIAELLPEKRNALVKSGTLTGVSNYAGYIKTNQGLCPFVIMLNQNSNYRDKILDLLEQYCTGK